MVVLARSWRRGCRCHWLLVVPRPATGALLVGAWATLALGRGVRLPLLTASFVAALAFWPSAAAFSFVWICVQRLAVGSRAATTLIAALAACRMLAARALPVPRPLMVARMVDLVFARTARPLAGLVALLAGATASWAWAFGAFALRAIEGRTGLPLAAGGVALLKGIAGFVDDLLVAFVWPLGAERQGSKQGVDRR